MSEFQPTQVDCSDMFEIVPTYDARTLTPTALQLFELLSFLSTGLPEDIIKALALELLSADAPFDEAAYEEGRDALLEHPLIVLEGPRKKLVVIDTIQDRVFATLNDGKRKRFFEGVTRKIWSEWPAALPRPSREPLLPEPKKRAQRLLVSRWPDCEDLHHTIARLEKLYPDLANMTSEEGRLLFSKLTTEGAWFQIERGYRSQTIPSLFRAMEITLQIDHEDRDAVLADLHFCFGVVAMESNDFAASRAHKEKSFALVSRICEELGVEDERLAVAYSERGIARVQDGRRLDDAVADIQASVRIMRELDAEYVPHSREANLAWALLAQGRPRDADRLLRRSLAARTAALGEDDGESARTGLLLNAAAAAAAAVSEDPGASHEYRRRAWHHLVQTVGKRDSCTARVAHKLAEELLCMKRPDEALVLINEAITAWGVDPLANHNEEARTIYLKSRALATLGKSETATRLRNEAIMNYNVITRETKDVDTISMEDFDRIVPFWSR